MLQGGKKSHTQKHFFCKAMIKLDTPKKLHDNTCCMNTENHHCPLSTACSRDSTQNKKKHGIKFQNFQPVKEAKKES